MKYRQKHFVAAKAFTLLELILVMLILSTVLAMAAPSLRGFFSSRQINDCAEQIVVLTRYAKSQAIYEGRPYRVNFNMTERWYWVSVLENSQFEADDRMLTRRYTIPGGIKLIFHDINAGNERIGEVKVGDLPRDIDGYYIEFDPRGYTEQFGIGLEDDKDNVIVVRCYSPSENFEITEIFKYNER